MYTLDPTYDMMAAFVDLEPTRRVRPQVILAGVESSITCSEQHFRERDLVRLEAALVLSREVAVMAPIVSPRGPCRIADPGGLPQAVVRNGHFRTASCNVRLTMPCFGVYFPVTMEARLGEQTLDAA